MASRGVCPIFVLLLLVASACSPTPATDLGPDSGPEAASNAAEATQTSTPEPMATATAEPSPTATPEPLGPPNIVVILMDDMRADQIEFMPKTKAFFDAGGTTFEDSIVSFPECCPARATAFSGQYAHNHGVLSGSLPSGGVTRFDESTTFALALDDAGYRTMLVGKYLNGYGDHAPPNVPPGWDDWFALVDPSTLNWWDFDVFADGDLISFGTEPEEHRTTVLGDRALADLDDALSEDDPFLLWFAPVAPHIGYANRAEAEKGTGVAGRNGVPSALLPGAGWFPPPSVDGRHDDYRWPIPETFADREGKPLAISSASELSRAQTEDVEADYRNVIETLAGVDEVVDALLQRLDEGNALDNTVVILTSDNGFFFGEHRIVYLKYWPYEESIRVPLLARGPGFPAATVPAPVSNIDLMPTLLGIGETAVTWPIDGLDLRSIAANPTPLLDRPLLIESGPTFGRNVYAGVRVNGFKYVEYRDGHREFYDLVADPNETTNLFNPDEIDGVQSQMARQLGALRACSGQDCNELDLAASADPVAVIDPVGTPEAGDLFILTGNGSFDPDGGELTFDWSVVSGPATELLGRSNPGVRGIAPPVDEPLVMALRVTDDEGRASTTTITITSVAPS